MLHRKVCNHPHMIKSTELLEKEPEYKRIVKSVSESYEHSGKLLGLVDLLT